MYALVKDGLVIQKENVCFPVHPSCEWVECDDICEVGDRYENGVFLKVEEPEKPYDQKRAEEYPSIDNLTVALWESVVEGRNESLLELQQKRLEVKEKYPKPTLD